MQRGFVLQTTYRLRERRPVVLLWGRLECGRSFLVRDDRQRPRFHVLRRDAERAVALGARLDDRETNATTMRGDPVACVVLDRPADTPALRERLIASGIPCLEADIRFADRFLIDHGIRGGLEIRGEARPGRGVDLVFDNPDLEPADWTPELSVLSLDIETDPQASRLLSIALAGCGAEEVLLLCPPGSTCPRSATGCETEATLLAALSDRVRQLDPDVLTGWNVIGFDLAVLARLADRAGVPLCLGRNSEPLRVVTGNRGLHNARLPGRLVLDGIQLLRSSFVRVESYGLDAVSRQLLGRGKTIVGDHRGEQISRAFETDREKLVEYNLNDARLVLEILDELHLVELAVERSRLTGLPPDRGTASIAAFDLLYLTELHRRGIVGPGLGTGDGPAVVTSGGHVLQPSPGLYRNVLVFDFRSLYPSIIRTFQIDPLGRVYEPADDEPTIAAPNGAHFRRQPGILPRLLDELFPRREAARKRGDRVASQAIKILMNSFYGVLGTPACRFADPALANAITGFGRELLLWSKARFETKGYEVLYGDTDSLFVRSGLEAEADADRLGHRLVDELNTELDAHIADKWEVRSRLRLQYERLYLRLLLPALRGGTAGARKRYAGLVRSDATTEVVFTGMEVVRRDWTDLARTVQRELYTRLFHDRPIEEFLASVVRDLRAGRLDEQLVYRKALRRRLEQYTASTPPHVAAARKRTRGTSSRRISYVITLAGPEPAEELRSPIDHEHYVQRQIRPVSRPVLERLGLDFDRVIGDDSQLRLF